MTNVRSSPHWRHWWPPQLTVDDLAFSSGTAAADPTPIPVSDQCALNQHAASLQREARSRAVGQPDHGEDPTGRYGVFPPRRKTRETAAAEQSRSSRPNIRQPGLRSKGDDAHAAVDAAQLVTVALRCLRRRSPKHDWYSRSLGRRELSANGHGTENHSCHQHRLCQQGTSSTPCSPG